MKMLRITLIAAFCTIFNFSVNAQQHLSKILEKGEIRIGMTGDQPPFSMRASNGKLIGYEVELAELLAMSMDVNLKIIPMNFKELLPALEEGKVDAVMSGMTITPDRNLKAMFVGPYMVSGKSILTKNQTLAQSDETEDIDNIELRLAALKGSTSENFVKNVIQNARVNLVDNYDEGIKLLLTGGVDALVADYPVCILAQLRFPEAGLMSLDEPLTIEPIGMALPPDDPLMVNMVQNFFNSLILAGVLDEMQAFWFESGAWVRQVDEVKINHHNTSSPMY